ncbi:hypothetical protein Pla100_33860 [Neorhodopirellula pilleata]|uniref:Uncharacterized protein n=1 Tax=Neorhodopirellula pilleata TaxID=2714738 RepID=A0A5C6A758_9BACT|nr:hypothetical protein Pla100_33860 [Neorhodopirellula pilleata]
MYARITNFHSGYDSTFYTPHLFDPHELVSWVNKVRKLDNDALPTFRFSLVLAASSGEHK